MNNCFDKNYYLEFGHRNENIGTVVRHLDLFRSSKNICIIPCGYGQVVGWCLSNNLKCIGYDVSEFLTDIGQYKNNVFCEDLRKIEKYNDFDLIVCVDLLEHFEIDDIETSLKNLYNMLSVDGRLILRVGTDMLPEFDSDPTHKTKENMNWWLNIARSKGFYLEFGPMEIGEFVLSKKNLEEDIFEYLYENKFEEIFTSFIGLRDILEIKDPNIFEKIVNCKGEQISEATIRNDGLLHINFRNRYYLTTEKYSDKMRMLFDSFYIFIIIENRVICKIPAKVDDLRLSENMSVWQKIDLV